MNEREIFFEMKFDEKYTLSQKQIFDRLYLQILDARNLVATDGTVLTQRELDKSVPPQVDGHDGETLAFLGWLVYCMLLISICISLPLALISGGSTQLAWLHLATVQFIAHIPMFGPYFPNNIEKLMLNVIDLVNLKFVKLDSVFGISRGESEINMQGYSDNLIFSLGLLSYILTFATFFGAVFFLLYNHILHKIQCVNRACKILRHIFLYNFFIRLTFVAMLTVTIAVLMNLSMLDFNSPENVIAGSISIILVPCLFCIPFALLWFLMVKQPILPEYETIVKYESSYNEQRVHLAVPLLFNVIFAIKRLVFAFILVVGRNLQACQFQPIALLCGLSAVYAIAYKPFLY